MQHARKKEVVMRRREKMDKKMTYVATYRGVSGYRMGLHEGANRDVFIAGDDIPGNNKPGGYGFVPVGLAADAFQKAEETLDNMLGRVDQVFVYLGAKGAGPGLTYLHRLMEKNESKDISIVACDCNEQGKQWFADQKNLPIIWSECGGHRTLGRIVDRILRE